MYDGKEEMSVGTRRHALLFIKREKYKILDRLCVFAWHQLRFRFVVSRWHDSMLRSSYICTAATNTLHHHQQQHQNDKRVRTRRGSEKMNDDE